MSRVGVYVLMVHAFLVGIHCLVLVVCLSCDLDGGGRERGIVSVGWEAAGELFWGRRRRGEGDESSGFGCGCGCAKEKRMWRRDMGIVGNTDDGGGLEVVFGVQIAEEGRVVGRR